MLHELFILKLLPKLLWLCCHRIILKEVDVIFLPQNSLFILLDRVCLGIIVGMTVGHYHFSAVVQDFFEHAICVKVWSLV